MGIYKIISPVLLSAFYLMPLCVTAATTTEKAKGSRHDIGDDASTKTLLENLAIKNRAIDPFGKYQDPNYKEPAKATHQPTVAAPKEKIEILLENEIDKLRDKIGVINNGAFSVGSNFYKRGSILNVAVADKTFKIEVVRVTREKIVFLNTNNQKMIDLNMAKQNTGIHSGGDNIELPTHKDPIILDK